MVAARGSLRPCGKVRSCEYPKVPAKVSKRVAAEVTANVQHRLRQGSPSSRLGNPPRPDLRGTSSRCSTEEQIQHRSEDISHSLVEAHWRRPLSLPSRRPLARLFLRPLCVPLVRPLPGHARDLCSCICTPKLATFAGFLECHFWMVDLRYFRWDGKSPLRVLWTQAPSQAAEGRAILRPNLQVERTSMAKGKSDASV